LDLGASPGTVIVGGSSLITLSIASLPPQAIQPSSWFHDKDLISELSEGKAI